MFFSDSGWTPLSVEVSKILSEETSKPNPRRKVEYDVRGQTYEVDWKANRPGMYKVDTAITFAFIFDYLLNLYIADHRLQWIVSKWAILDFIVILPLFIEVGVGDT